MQQTKWQSYLNDKLGDLKKKNKYVDLVESSITGNVNPKMKEAIAVSEIVTFATHMRAKVRLPDKTLVPVNAINFIIADSGASKDRSLNQARKCFDKVYRKMETYLKKSSIDRAVKLATDAGAEEDWREYFVPPRPIFGGANPTLSGIIAHLNAMQDTPIGGGHIYTGEFGAALSTGNGMLELLQFAAEIYDLGNMKADWRKTVEAQGEEIKNMNFSAIFITSPGHIIYDQTVKKKFLMEFTTKLARRSFFNFNRSNIEIADETVEELLARERLELETSLKAVDKVETLLDKVQPKSANILKLDTEVWEIYGVLKRHYEDRSQMVDPELESYRLSLAHTQWRALKLAGAYTQMDNRSIVTIKDLAEAVYYCEATEDDIRDFNVELNKESYELLHDYVSSIYRDHPISFTAHKLNKMGYITGVTAVKSKLKELADMANDIAEGIYTADGTSLTYEKLIQKDVIGASYIKCTGTKDERAKKCREGYSYKEVAFDRVQNLMKNDTAYCPFEFKDGIRKNENIIGGTKLLILDVDTSDVMDTELHDMLSDYRHHIARTSDISNPFKFRVALELDSYVTLDGRKWKLFVESIAEYLGIDIDSLPQSQIYYGYASREVLSNIEGDMLEVKEHLLHANAEVSKKKTPSAKEALSMLSNPMVTFNFAYEAEEGRRSLSLIRAAKYAKDLGMQVEVILDLMEDINNYWVMPLEEERLEKTILDQIRRWS